MPEGRRPRGATPRLRTGAEARRTPCLKGGGQEELPHVRGQGQWPRVPGFFSGEILQEFQQIKMSFSNYKFPSLSNRICGTRL